MSYTPDGYNITGRRVGGSAGFQPFCIVNCGNCTNRLEFAVVGRPSPEHIAKNVRSRGWEFELHNHRNNRCPECIKKREAIRKGESGRKTIEVFGKTVDVTGLALPSQPPQPQQQQRMMAEEPETEDKPMKTYKLLIKTDKGMIELVRALTGFGELMTVAQVELKQQAIAAPPEHQAPAAGPEAPRPRPEQGAQAVGADPEPTKPQLEPEVRAAEADTAKRHVSPERRESYIKRTAKARENVKKRAIDKLTEFYVQHSEKNPETLAQWMNGTDVKAIGRWGWTVTNIKPLMAEAGIA